MNRILWTIKAAKQLRRLDATQQKLIRDAVGTLAYMPASQNVKALKSHALGFRLRAGQYRVLFDWDQSTSTVYVEAIRKRDERTY